MVVLLFEVARIREMRIYLMLGEIGKAVKLAG